MGTFMAEDLKEEVTSEGIKIIHEGIKKKFVNQVEQIAFSGKNAIKNHLDVLFVTERAVFKLTKGGLELIEIAPGIDLKQDILDKMDFKPIISKDIKRMDERLFKASIMKLKEEI